MVSFSGHYFWTCPILKNLEIGIFRSAKILKISKSQKSVSYGFFVSILPITWPKIAKNESFGEKFWWKNQFFTIFSIICIQIPRKLRVVPNFATYLVNRWIFRHSVKSVNLGIIQILRYVKKNKIWDLDLDPPLPH